MNSWNYNNFYKTCDIDMPIETIWSEIDKETNEVSINDDVETKMRRSHANIILPPLKTEDKFIKGLLASNAVDYIFQVYPEIKDNFYIIANTMWGSFSKTENADAQFSCYENEARESWFRKTYPEKENCILIPTQDADFASERIMYPIDLGKDIDVLVVSGLYDYKNLDILLKSLMYVDKKYSKRLNCVLIAGLRPEEKRADKLAYKELIQIAGSEDELSKYIKIIDSVQYTKLFMYYSRAKVTALTSIFEGRNRSIQESVLCSTPVVCFSCFNKYIRGNAPILPEECAYFVEEFSAEAFGEKLYSVLNSDIPTNIREIGIKFFNRGDTVDRIIKSIPYYVENIPKLNDSHVFDNEFINRIISEKFGYSFEDFIYKRNLTMTSKINENHTLPLYLFLNKATGRI